IDEADSATQVAEELSAPDDVLAQALWRQVRAKLLARAGEHEEAERLAREAVSLLGQTDMLNSHANALTDLAEVLALTGRPEAALPDLERAVGLFERKGNAVQAGRARAALPALREAAAAT